MTYLLTFLHCKKSLYESYVGIKYTHTHSELCKHCYLARNEDAQFYAMCARDPKTDDVILSAMPISYFMPIFIALLYL